jgi:tetratricopeptide (TPR) repeat protein
MKKNNTDNKNGKRVFRRKNFEIKFYENILKDRPDCVFVLAPLGDAYTRKGFYKEGLDVDKKLVKLKPNDPTVRYNLACSLSLLGREKEAFEALKKAVLFGYDDFSYMSKDSDLANVRKLPEYEKFSQKVKKIKG